MSEMEGKKFKDWMVATGKMPSTASAYLSGVNTVSKHCGKDVFQITDIGELTRLYQLYGPQGEHAQIGASNSNNVQNGLKQWLDYQKHLAQLGVDPDAATCGLVEGFGSPALNQILYGPPGTGKTYATIEAALEILDPEFLAANREDRAALKERFDELAAEGQVRFVTFHQSFSYEDFVEGLRAVTNDGNQLEYKVEPGGFKRLCDDARTQGAEVETGVRNNPRIWKISIDGTGTSPTKAYCLDKGEARIGWGHTGDLRLPLDDCEYYQKLGSGDKGTLSYFAEEMAVGDILLCIHSADSINAVGVVTSDYRFEQAPPAGVIAHY